MLIKTMDDENFNHYKNPSMVVAFPRCNFKCGKGLCQNSPLATSPDIEIEPSEIVKRYTNNNLTSALVLAGLEPLDTFEDLVALITEFRKYTQDVVVIYTGYYNILCEKANEIHILSSMFKNIIVKFGRYIPNQTPHYDETLGVYLASDNQYAEKIS